MVKDFISMCRTIYIPIHGEELVKRVFSSLTEDKLNHMVHIYRECPAFSWQNIEKYLMENNSKNIIILDNGKQVSISTFYSNAIQHYILKDY